MYLTLKLNASIDKISCKFIN